MHLLDTDTLTHLANGHPTVTQRLRECTDPKVAMTVIAWIEMLRGRFDFLMKAADRADLLRAQELLTRTLDALHRLPVVPLDERAVDLFVRLREVKKLKKIGRADLLIASMALANDAVLVTRNVKHFALVPDLKHVNWVD